MTVSMIHPDEPANPEAGAWDDVRSGWSQVYGSFDRLGVSVELHDFRTEAPLDWGRSFHRDSVELCLNLTGRAQIVRGSDSLTVPAGAAASYARVEEPLLAHRAAGERHRFVTLEFSQQFIASHLDGAESQASALVRKSVFARRPTSAVAPPCALTDSQRMLAQSFANPPVAHAALPLWYQSKVMEAAAVFLFSPAPEFFCERRKRLTRERVERVCNILRERLAEPPSLQDLGREVGVSPFYLSRMFSQEMAVTIPQYIRRLRMERADLLLREGGHNVSEAAFAVGYSSLGHFSKSFCEVMGCCPTLYPLARNLHK